VLAYQPNVPRHDFDNDDPDLLLSYHIAIGIRNVSQTIFPIDDCAELAQLERACFRHIESFIFEAGTREGPL
jgi:hypothetical protein